MSILIVSFSYTCNTRRVADAIEANLSRNLPVEQARIEPLKERGYPAWLARSFVPGWKVAIKDTIFDLRPYQLVCLGFPKWTLDCPPLSCYLSRMRTDAGQTFAPFMTYGGFDQQRYLRNIERRLARRDLHLLPSLALKRSFILENAFNRPVEAFCTRIRRWLSEYHQPCTLQ